MTYWTADKRLFKKDFDKVDAFVRVFLVLMGLLVGASVAFYIAVRTLPLPTTTQQYFYKVQ